MEDVRKLVPRTPPEGLLEWAERQLPELDRDALIIETVWAEDWSLECMLDEWARGRKVRAIRATCSACTESALLWRAQDRFGDYGFVQDWDTDGPGTICCDGDEATCPLCGAKVTVRSKSKLRSKGYFVAAEAQVMSAAVVGPDHLLALTGWTLQRRIHANARRELCAIPAEAYVFSQNDCAQLMGWTNAYSGTAGYFIQYTRAWRQPKAWRERWGDTREIYGLTPALISESCLPNCKLDVYMQARFPSHARYPVPYLRLYQQHPNVEALLLHGLPLVLDEMLDEEVCRGGWREENCKGLAELPELRWEQHRPAKLLRLTRDELRMAREQGWGALFWRLFTRTKATGETLSDKDIQNAFYLGDEHILDLVGRGPVAKSIRYLLRQTERQAPEPEDEDPDPNSVIDAQILLDYWDMAERAGRDLSDPSVRFPQDLLAAHEAAAGLLAAREAEEAAGKFRIRRHLLARYTFKANGLIIRPAGSQAELTREGDLLHHCVASYGKRHANGGTAIFFIRRAKAPRIPFYTLELNEKALTVVQNRGMCNCARTPEVAAFEALWLEWVRTGAQRDAYGRPVLPGPARVA